MVQNALKCYVCGGDNIVVLDEDKKIVDCRDCKLITRPLNTEVVDAERNGGNPDKKRVG